MGFIKRDRVVGGARRSANDPLSGADLLNEIGRDLRGVYRDLVREPLPENLRALVERLERRETPTRS